MEINKKFYRANDVKEILDVSLDTAYRIIRKLNAELATQGYFTVAGRISVKVFDERFKVV